MKKALIPEILKTSGIQQQSCCNAAEVSFKEQCDVYLIWPVQDVTGNYFFELVQNLVNNFYKANILSAKNEVSIKELNEI